MRSLKTHITELADPKFVKPIKTEYHYTGKINGKTFVVPHSYNYEMNIGGKINPMHHHIVTSLNHTIHNNPTLTPEEHARVHAHIALHHGERESAKLEEGMGSHKVPVYHSDRKTLLGHVKSSATSVGAAKVAKSKSTSFERVNGKYAWVSSDPAVKKLEEHRYLGFDHKGGQHDIQATSTCDAHLKVAAKANTPKSQDHKIHVHLHTLDTPEGPKEVRHDTMFEETEESMIQEGRPIRGDVFHHHQTLIAKKTLKMSDAGARIMGGQTKEEARAHLKKMGWTQKQIHQHEHELNERTLTGAEDTKKEEIVHSMKKKLQGFKARYGDKAKSVMYATATKQAKRLAEEEVMNNEETLTEGLHAYKVIHKGREIDKRKHAGKLFREAIKYGDEVTISHNYGIDSGKQGTVLHPNKVRTNERGVPTDVPGAYKPVDHKKEHVVKLHSGSYAVVPKGSLTKLKEDSMLKESEQLDELSKGTLKSYIKKASPSLGYHSYVAGSDTRRSETAKKAARSFFAKQGEESDKISKRREKGIQQAASKLEESSSALNEFSNTPKKPGSLELWHNEKVKQEKEMSERMKREKSKTLNTIREVLSESFTRKHFKAIAEVIKSHTDANTRQKLADAHANAFTKDNPRFSHEKFHAAAGTTYTKAK
jgi:hypothetical protein